MEIVPFKFFGYSPRGLVKVCCESAEDSKEGNVTQKKWTCSIKALPRGKDPRSIGKWFYDSGIRKAKRLGSAIVGHTIWVLWPSESTFFRGIVTCYDADQGLHVVKYDDGDKETLRLWTESYHLEPEKPPKQPEEDSNNQPTTPEAQKPEKVKEDKAPAGAMAASPQKRYASPVKGLGSPQRPFPSPVKSTKSRSLQELSQSGTSVSIIEDPSDADEEGGLKQLSPAGAIADYIERPPVVDLVSDYNDDGDGVIDFSGEEEPLEEQPGQQPAVSGATMSDEDDVNKRGDSPMLSLQLDGLAASPQAASRAAGQNSTSPKKIASQAEHIQVLLKAPYPTAISVVREGQENWVSTSQIHQRLLLKEAGKESFRQRIKREADLRPANLQERRFLASTGVFPGTPSRATLMSVKAACAALQSYRVPADHVKALAEVARAPKLTQKQLRSLPPVTPSLPEAPQDPSKEDPATSKQRLQPKPSQPVKQPAAAALAGLLASAKAAGGAGCAQAQPHASTCRAPPGPAAAGRQGQKEAWSPHPSDTEPQEQQAVGASQGEEVDSESQPTQSYSDKPSQNGPEPSAFGGAAGFGQGFGSLAAANGASNPFQLVSQTPARSAFTTPSLKAEDGSARGKPGWDFGSIPKMAKIDAWAPISAERTRQTTAAAAAPESSQAADMGRMGSPEANQDGTAAQAPASAAPDAPNGPESARSGSLPAKRKSTSEAGGASSNAPSAGTSTEPSSWPVAEQEEEEAAPARQPPKTCMARLRAGKSTSAAGQRRGSGIVKAPAQIVERVMARQAKKRPPPYNASGQGCPPEPCVVDDTEDLPDQEDLVESIFSREAYEEYQRRRGLMRGKAWSAGMIPDYFLYRVEGETREETEDLKDGVVDQIAAMSPAQRGRHMAQLLQEVDLRDRGNSEDLKDGVVDQIAAWLAMSPAQRSRHMAQLLKEVELDDMAHPAYARFKQVYEPLGLRDKERGLKFRKDVPGWTLLGEYCGVYDKLDEVERRVNADPLGLGTMRRDRVTELEYTCKETRAGISSALRTRWKFPLMIDPSRMHNQLCLINDCLNVPGSTDQPNVRWLECEDSRTLQPHLFIFTAFDVKKGQEALLDYGEGYHQLMEDCLRRALAILEARRAKEEAEAAVRKLQKALKAQEREAAEVAKQHSKVLAKVGKERKILKMQADQERQRAKQAQQQLAETQASVQSLEQERAAAQEAERQLAEAQASLKRLEEELKVEKARAAAASLEKHGFSNTVRSPAALPMPAYQNGNSTNTAELEKQVAHQQVRCERLRNELHSARAALQELGAASEAKDASLAQAEAEKQECRRQAWMLHQNLKAKETDQENLIKLWADTCSKSKHEIERLSGVAVEMESGRIQVEQQLAELAAVLQLPAGMTVKELLQLAKTTKLQIVPVCEGPALQLPEPPKPAPLRIGFGPHYPDAEPQPADTDSPAAVQKEPQVQPLGQQPAAFQSSSTTGKNSQSAGKRKRSDDSEVAGAAPEAAQKLLRTGLDEQRSRTRLPLPPPPDSQRASQQAGQPSAGSVQPDRDLPQAREAGGWEAADREGQQMPPHMRERQDAERASPATPRGAGDVIAEKERADRRGGSGRASGHAGRRRDRELRFERHRDQERHRDLDRCRDLGRYRDERGTSRGRERASHERPKQPRRRSRSPGAHPMSRHSAKSEDGEDEASHQFLQRQEELEPAQQYLCTFCNMHNHSNETCEYLLNPSLKPPEKCSICGKRGHREKSCYHKKMAARKHLGFDTR